LTEVCNSQGDVFPYTKGLWLVSNLIAAINTNDLDAMDESVPFTKYTLDELFGRCHTNGEYEMYFNANPNSKKYHNIYDRFLNENCHAFRIVEQNDHNSGKDKCIIS
jgi:hypothetical protein